MEEEPAWASHSVTKCWAERETGDRDGRFANPEASGPYAEAVCVVHMAACSVHVMQPSVSWVFFLDLDSDASGLVPPLRHA